jgi:hypothetical protein
MQFSKLEMHFFRMGGRICYFILHAFQILKKYVFLGSRGRYHDDRAICGAADERLNEGCF